MGLDSFSEHFIAWLQERRPELVQHVERQEAPGGAGFARLRLRSAISEAGLDTVGEEVTVWFDEWHDHYGWWLEQTDEAGFDLGLRCLDGIVAEFLVSVSEFAGDEWRSSRLVPAGTPLRALPGRVLRLRSWAGTYNQDAESASWPARTLESIPVIYREWDSGPTLAPGEEIPDPE